MKRLVGIGGLVSLMVACGGATDTEQEVPVIIITGNGSHLADHATHPFDGVEADDSANPTANLTGIALLGNGSHTIDSVSFSQVAGPEDALRGPRDLAFNPENPNQLWIVNVDDNSTVVITDVGTAQHSSRRLAGFGKDHFMARPTAIAFGQPGSFASAHEEDEATQSSTPADFMGPTLWTTDLSIYDGGHAGHIDMLHNSPNATGITWERDNRYWLFDGWHNAIVMYDFHADHGPGGVPHDDGECARYVEGEVRYVPDVPSHMVFDHATKLVYVADSGNNRIAALDTTVGEAGQRTSPNYDGGAQYYMNGGSLETFVDGADAMLELPSGLEMHDGMLFVGDNKLSRIVALNMQGELVDYLDLSSEIPSGGLMGLAFDASGVLYALDSVNNRVVRIAPSGAGGNQ